MGAQSKLLDHQDKTTFSAECSLRELLRRAFSEFVGSPERRRLLIACIALVFSGGTNLAVPKLLGLTLDSHANHEPRVRRKVILALSIYAAGALASWIRVYSFRTAALKIENRIRKRLLSHALARPLEDIHKAGTGEIEHGLRADVTAVAECATKTIEGFLRGANSAIGGSIMLFSLSPRLTLLTLALVPFIGSNAMFWRTRSAKLDRCFREIVGDACSFAVERVQAAETVKSLAATDVEVDKFSSTLKNAYIHGRRSASSEGLMMGGLSLMTNACLMGVLCVGGVLVRKGELTSGKLTSFAIYSGMVGLGFASLLGSYSELVKGAAAAEGLLRLLSCPLEKTGGDHLTKVSGELTFENVTYTYKGREEAVLRNLNLVIPTGQRIALAGKSGAGKTTLVRLLLQLIEPQSGRILLDGVDLRGVDKTWLRKQVFTNISQNAAIFRGTVLENIRIGMETASREQAIAAAEKACADSFIRELPEGYDTVVGERGCSLSGGQRQRIAIARAFLREATCLILDESTSSLDISTEHLVQKALEEVMKDKTAIIVAHRPSALKFASRILVLSEGYIVEDGSYDELMTRESGQLRTLVNDYTNALQTNQQLTI